jgi:hypothetical protein
MRLLRTEKRGMPELLTEKRTEVRAITDVALEVFDMATHELVGVARLLSLSPSGACAETTADLSDHSNLFVRMLLGNHLVAAPVSAVWARSLPRGFEYGFRFGPYSDEMQEIVKMFIQDNISFYSESNLAFPPTAG